MKRKNWISVILILIIAAVFGALTWPKGPDIKIGKYYKEVKIHQGLDLLGGTHMVYEADMSKIDPKDRSNALESAKAVIEQRINAFGVSEPSILSTSGADNYRIIVELPGVSDIDQAIKLIGQTAQLEFREGIEGKSLQGGQLDPQQAGIKDNWQDIGLNGSLFKKATVQINQNTIEPEVSIEFKDEGSKIFAEATARSIGKPIAIFLDEDLISAPKVNQAIDGGSAVISGNFTKEESKMLSIQLNAGALPVPTKLIEQRSVGATLGQDSVRKSFIAGLIGILFVILFMIVRYRFPGFIASIALFIYSLIVIGFFKLIPVTMTLAGIAGFILSIGMAVDANILIFERMREELRRGRTYSSSIKTGFARAWSSIRDSNISSLITCAILYFFGTGLVRGFALTLAVGVLVSMFTAIIVTKNLLYLFLSKKVNKK